MEGYVRKAVPADVFALAPRLREDDVAEIRAGSGQTPEQALAVGLAVSPVCLSLVGADGTVLGMLGVSPTPDPEAGAVWMLASDGLMRYRVQFIRECRAWCDALNGLYPILFNYVDARNATHIRWLRWCGFTFIQTHEGYGVERRPFIEFVRIRPCAKQSAPRPPSTSRPR